MRAGDLDAPQAALAAGVGCRLLGLTRLGAPVAGAAVAGARASLELPAAHRAQCCLPHAAPQASHVPLPAAHPLRLLLQRARRGCACDGCTCRRLLCSPPSASRVLLCCAVLCRTFKLDPGYLEAKGHPAPLAPAQRMMLAAQVC